MRSLLPREPWRRNQYVMVATVFVGYMGFAFVIPFIPLYVRQLGIEGEPAIALWSGVLIGIAPLLAGLLAPVWGRWADRHGRKRVAIRVLGCYVVLLALSAIVTDVRQLLALRVGVGLFGGIGPLSLAMATALAPREQTGRAIGSIQSAQILSGALGPFGGGLLADLIGIRWTFVLTAAICAVALALVGALYREAAPTRTPALPPVPFATIMRWQHIPGLLVVLFLVNFIGRSFTPILPLYLHQLNVPTTRLAFSTGLLISAYSFAAALSAAALGRATRTHPPQRLLRAALFGGAVTVLPMAVAPSFRALLALALLLGLASGGALTLCYTIGGLLVPSEHRTASFGLFSGAALFGGAVSPSVAGLLVRWNLRGIYSLDALLFLLLALCIRPRTLGTASETLSVASTLPTP